MCSVVSDWYRVRDRVARYFRGPTMLGQLRRMFLGMCLAWVAVGLPFAAPFLTRTDLVLLVPAIALLVPWWLVGLRRDDFPAWSWLVEGVAIGAVLVAADFTHALGLLFLWTTFRMMYGRARQKVAAGGFVAVIIGVTGVISHAGADLVLPMIFTALLAMFVMHLLATAAAARDRGAARERATTAAGAALAAATTRSEAVNVALVAALGMDDEVGAALVAIGSGAQLRIEGVAGRCAPTAAELTVDVGALPATALAALVPGGYAVLRGTEAARAAGAFELEPRAGIVLAPLAVQGTVFGLLVLALDQVPPTDLSSTATSLADAVAITLDQLLTSNRLRVVVEHSPDALFLTDTCGIVRFANPAATVLLGRCVEDLTGIQLQTLAHPEDADHLVGTGNGGLRPMRFRAPDGGWIDTETVVEMVEERDGSASLVVTVRDVSDRQRLELELRHAQKLESVGRLAAGVAHEINTPIQFIGDNVRFLGEAVTDLLRMQEAYGALAEALDDPGALARVRELAGEVDLDFVVAEIPDAIKQTLDGVDRVAKIVRAMKSFGHPGNDEKAQVDLNEAITSTLVVANNEIKFVADVVADLGELPLVLCHRGDINQVVLNLVINAAHAIGETAAERGRGTIRVRTRRETGWAVIEVEDSGTGIPPEVVDKVFDQFFTTKQVGTGTGQGLALARSLVVDRHGGTIDFTTEVGVGTVFTVRLPLSDRDAVAAIPEGAEALR